jgi:hypothetical protein
MLREYHGMWHISFPARSSHILLLPCIRFLCSRISGIESIASGDTVVRIVRFDTFPLATLDLRL